MKESYEIRLPVFEGPFDLMLFFIERDELDIRDIPIARITEEFLRFIRSMEALNLEVASDFILFAATLMKIKARMLLPRPTLNEQGEEVDPRADLVRHLLEYKRFKDAAGQLAYLEALALARYPRLNLAEEVQELADAAEENSQLVNLNLTSLSLTFQKVLAGYLDRGQDRQHVVVSVPYTVDDQKAQVSALVAVRGRVSFIDLLHTCADKLQMVYTFMAVLEMLNERTLNIIPTDGVNGFWVEPVSLERITNSE
jgi:segregation and condensation protein A